MFHMLWECLKIVYALLEFLLKYIAKPSLLIEKLFIERRTLSRVPTHVAVIYTEKAKICLDALTDLVVRSASAGVKQLSVYDPWSYIRSNERILEKLIAKASMTKRAKTRIEVHINEPLNDVKHHSGVIAVYLLGKESGRQALVRACREICPKYDADVINTKLITSYLANNSLTEPDLLLKVGATNSMAGYLPWALRVTEIVTVPHLSNHVSFRQFISFFDSYYQRDRRLGR